MVIVNASERSPRARTGQNATGSLGLASKYCGDKRSEPHCSSFRLAFYRSIAGPNDEAQRSTRDFLRCPTYLWSKYVIHLSGRVLYLASGCQSQQNPDRAIHHGHHHLRALLPPRTRPLRAMLCFLWHIFPRSKGLGSSSPHDAYHSPPLPTLLPAELD